MVAFSGRPDRKVSLSGEARLAVELANAYMNGHLPEAGGWLDQDSYYVRLIEMAMSARAVRKATADRQNQRKRWLRKGKR